MPKVVGVRFKSCGKIYHFEVDGVAAKPGMRVVIESEMGLSLGIVVSARQDIEQTGQPFKKVLRIATVQDIETDKNNRLLEEEARTFCVEKVKGRNLPMKIVGTEATLDKKRLIFYFTAEGRIDFRELVRDLASRFRTRIEMRQIGVRDEVKLIGGIGICGREVCCRTFLTSFEPISIRMAKKQEVVLNTVKLSGICGRLMCCLGYEIDQLVKEEETLSLSEIRSEEDEVESMVVSEEGVPEERGNDVPQAPEIVKTHLNSEVRSQPVGESTLQEKSERREDAKPPDEQEKISKPEKGRPFSRRKKFWRKKRQ